MVNTILPDIFDPDFEANLSDEIRAKNEVIKTLEDALEEANTKYEKLEAETDVLRHNKSIKTSIIRYAKVFLFTIPVVCLILLLLSANQSLTISYFNLVWKLTIEPYAQAALIVAPILFTATILGFILKGVFSVPSDDMKIDTKTLMSEIKPSD